MSHEFCADFFLSDYLVLLLLNVLLEIYALICVLFMYLFNEFDINSYHFW